MIDAAPGKARPRAWAEGSDPDGYVLRIERNLALPVSPAN
jgi:hypothetical protein